MNRLFKSVAGVIALALVALPANAQTPVPELRYLSTDSVPFPYPADVKFDDQSEAVGQQQVVPTQAPQGAPDIPDIGSVTGTNYTNKYFGLTLTIPSGWSVHGSDTKKQLSEKGKELVTSDNPATKSELNRAVDSTLNLLTISERPVGSPGPNSMFICGAEKPPSVKTDADYMLALKNTLKYSQVPITIKRDVYSEQVGGVAFSVIDFQTDYSGVIVSQKYYAHIVKNYVLFFITIYQTDEQLKTLTEILKSAVLR